MKLERMPSKKGNVVFYLCPICHCIVREYILDEKGNETTMTWEDKTHDCEKED